MPTWHVHGAAAWDFRLLSGEGRSLFSPFEVDVGDVDLPLLALAGDLPGHVGQDGEHEEGGVDEELHGAELLLVRGDVACSAVTDRERAAANCPPAVQSVENIWKKINYRLNPKSEINKKSLQLFISWLWIQCAFLCFRSLIKGGGNLICKLLN